MTEKGLREIKELNSWFLNTNEDNEPLIVQDFGIWFDKFLNLQTEDS